MRLGALRSFVLALLAAAIAASVALAGCASEPEPSTLAADPAQPADWDLSTPESAVRSYLDWVSFSYRMANSDIPTATMTPEEAVRVDAYIQLNRIEGKGIEQRLATFEVVSVSEETSAAVLVARESWRYRYFSLDSLEYLTDELEASYDTTYTLVADGGGWVVARVEAAAAGEVQ